MIIEVSTTPQTIRERITRPDAQRQEQVITASPEIVVIDFQAGVAHVMPKASFLAPNTQAVQKFRKLADQWRKDTRHISSLSKLSMHPAYQKIIGMGYDALPLILNELKEKGGHWLWALHAITDEDPAPEGATFRGAVAAWIAWGKTEGYLT